MVRPAQAQAPQAQAKERTKAVKGEGGHLHALDPTEEAVPEPVYHVVQCRRCVVGYRASHFHCCRCRRIFRSAWAFERHQGGGPQGCLSDAQLVCRGLARRADDGVWAGKPMAESTRKSLRRIA